MGCCEVRGVDRWQIRSIDKLTFVGKSSAFEICYYLKQKVPAFVYTSIQKVFSDAQHATRVTVFIDSDPSKYKCESSGKTRHLGKTNITSKVFTNLVLIQKWGGGKTLNIWAIRLQISEWRED